MVPSSAVLFAPTRPLKMRPMSKGPISRMVVKLAAHPMKRVAPSCSTKGAAWITMMPPVKAAVAEMMGTLRTPIR